ncbi:oligosaccharide flippase family protein [Geodermatophilus ruber]|uniref:Polysaccharide transporter, PST family n=1 Tax=Geodermatophilus ruber TaxID=504800 RepID=A0A1I4DJM5_9ACTN|nr:oligosaccharide flippase family protein [Geodermatophilus ruber]SFK92061.1 polysaccharide transporter, PST family [Geodermatophilus ruber]
MVWQGASYLFGKLAVLVTTLVLARLLVPEDFGLVALAMVFITYADSIADLGVAQALVYLPRTAANTRAAMLSALGFAAVLGAGALLGAPVVAALFGEPDVAPLIQLLSISLVAGAVASVPESLMRRDLQFRRLSSAAVLRSVAVGIVSVVLAATGLGAAALVWGTIAGALVYVVATWALVPARPDVRVWRTQRAALGSVLGYGLPAAGGLLLSKLIFDIDYLIIGHQLGAEALGFYTMAFRIPELLILNVFFVVSSVTFPVYSQARSEPERLQRGYLNSVRIQAAYGVSAGLGTAAVAPVLIPVLLGENWVPVVAALVPLAVYAALRSLGAGANDIYKAIGRPGLSVQISLLRLVVLVPTLVLATRWGFAGVAWAQAGAAAVFVVLMQGVALRVLGLRASQLLRAAGPGLTAGAATGGAALLVVLLLPGADVVVLAVAVVAGLAAGGGTLHLLAPTLAREVLRMFRRRTPSRPPAA